MFHDQMTCNGMPSSSFPANFMWQLQHQQQHQQQQQPSSPCPNTHDFRSMSAVLGKRPTSMPFPGIIEGCEDDDLSDDGYHPGEKKRRLSLEQVRTLEKNFEMGSRLEPERKMQLARALGLQPRQIAIWFQNRRARWKTKQLEKDYDELKRQFEAVKSENDTLQSQNKKLQAEIQAMRVRGTSEPINLNKETEASCSNRSENSSEINLGISRTAAPGADSTPSTANQCRPLIFSPLRPGNTTVQLLQTSKSDAQCPKAENNAIHDENFCNMFSNIDDQPAFWPWSEN